MGNQEIAHPYGAGHEHHREAQPGKQRDKASGENEEMQTLYVSCYCKRMDPESYVRKKLIFHSGCKYFCYNSCG